MKTAKSTLNQVLRLLAIAFLLANSVLISRPVPVQAAVINLYVARNDDPTPNSNDCTTLAGDCSLREAVSYANMHAGSGDFSIEIPSGFTIVLDVETVDAWGEDDNQKGDLDIDTTMTISGDGTVVIDGGGYDRVIHVRPSGNLTLVGVEIRNGYPRGLDSYGTTGQRPSSGGGIRNEGILDLRNVKIQNNHTADGIEMPGGYGGGIYNFGTLTGTGVVISENYTGKGWTAQSSAAFEGGGGGGLYNESGSVYLINSTFENNYTGAGSNGYTGGSGGAIYNSDRLTLQNTEFLYNYAGNGTAAPKQGGGGGQGGAIFNDVPGKMSIVGGWFYKNRSGDGGNGLIDNGYSGNGGDGGKGGAISNSGDILQLNGAVKFEENSTGKGGECTKTWDYPQGGTGGHGGAILNSQYGTLGNGEPGALDFIVIGNQTGAGGKCDPGGSGGNGGGIFNEGWIISPLVVEMKNNRTGDGGAVNDPAQILGGDGGDGGALYNKGSIEYQGNGYQLGIEQSSFSGNFTGKGGMGGAQTTLESEGGDGGDGGAIYNSGVIAAIRFTRFEDNYTGAGWGTRLGGDPNKGGDGGNGGAIHNTQRIKQINSCLFYGNHTGNGGEPNANGKDGGAAGNGGAIAVTFISKIDQIYNSTFYRNFTGFNGRPGLYGQVRTGGYGGAVYTANDSSADVYILMSTLIENYTKRNPNSTAVDSGRGAGIYSGGSVIFSVLGSILDKNYRENPAGGANLPSDCSKRQGSPLQSLGFNLIKNPVSDFINEQNKCSVFVTEGSKPGPDKVGIDPKLKAFAPDPVLPTFYLEPEFVEDDPAASSPVIDMVPQYYNDTPLCAAVFTMPEGMKDQRLHDRPIFGNCDAGAIEVGSFTSAFVVFLPSIQR